MTRLYWLAVAALSPVVGIAGEPAIEWSGSLEFQARVFAEDSRWPGQAPEAGQLSLAASPELRWQSENGDQRASVVALLRWDAVDDKRSLADLREAYWAWQGDETEVLVGANTVFWGVTESVHLVDIVNQTDFAGDIDGEDKLGQPMVNVMVQKDWGQLDVFLMPWFRERTFPGADGRFRPALPVDADRAEYESSAGQSHLDVALRYSHYFGDFDVGLSVFSGTSREPRFVPSEEGGVLVPWYDKIDQAGLDLQYTRDAWLWKLEAIVRNGYSHSFAAAVGGFEHTFYQVGQSDADLGLLVEYQYDGRNASEPLTPADSDLFVGTRLAMNDIQDTAVLAGVAYDLDSGETFVNVEAERRLGDSWVLELRARAFSGAAPGDTTYPIANDDYVQLHLARHF
jgi:hypothetical protein